MTERADQPRVGNIYLVGNCPECGAARFDELEGDEWEYETCGHCRESLSLPSPALLTTASTI